MKFFFRKILNAQKNLEKFKETEFLFNFNKLCNYAEIVIKKDRKIIFCGNGGSASDSNHLATELVGKFKKKRRALNCISLASNSSLITAIGNDYGFNKIFSRQLEGVGKKGDLLICITTSGRSKNIIDVLKFARKNKIKTCLLTSIKAKTYKINADFKLFVPSKYTDEIQEMHIFIGHLICDYLDRNLKF